MKNLKKYTQCKQIWQIQSTDTQNQAWEKKTTLQIQKITKNHHQQLSMLILGQKISILNLQAIGNSCFSQVKTSDPKILRDSPGRPRYHFTRFRGSKSLQRWRHHLPKKNIWGVEPSKDSSRISAYIWGFPKMLVPNNLWFSYWKWLFWGVLGCIWAFP